jgi:hypothetical protein
VVILLLCGVARVYACDDCTTTCVTDGSGKDSLCSTQCASQ